MYSKMLAQLKVKKDCLIAVTEVFQGVSEHVVSLEAVKPVTHCCSHDRDLCEMMYL